jgi:hypothetical protein
MELKKKKVYATAIEVISLDATNEHSENTTCGRRQKRIGKKRKI